MLLMYCPESRSKGACDVTKCLYFCPKVKRCRCVEYTAKFSEIIKLQIDQKYIDKYGHPPLHVPIALRTREPRKPKEKK